VNNIFVSYLTQVEGTEGFEAHGAIFLVDNFPTHTSDAVIAFLTKERVKIIGFALHTIQIFQRLDVALFEP
jgi:hypothetical protein